MAKDNDKDKNKTPGLKGGRGVFGTPGVGYGGVMKREKPPGLKGGKGVFGTPGVGYGGKLTSNGPTSLAGGLGMQGYGNAATGANLHTPRNATMATRNYQYGEVMGKPPAPKPTAKPTRKPTEITIPGGGLKSAKVTPASSKSKPMATNRFTGSTLGFTSGKTTGSTVTKSGVAGKSTAASRAATRAYDKGGVAGPTKNAAGKNASSMTGKRK
jgi:hypothetical protein